MADSFLQVPKSMESPATRHYAITPSDTVDIPQRPRMIYILTTGNIAIRDELGTVLTYPVTAGQVMQFRGTRVMATNTTATAVAWE
jgi:hypothetical protein